MIALIRDRNVMNVEYQVESQLSYIFLRSQARSMSLRTVYANIMLIPPGHANACAVPSMARRARWGWS